jgi:hypothetical protein
MSPAEAQDTTCVAVLNGWRDAKQSLSEPSETRFKLVCVRVNDKLDPNAVVNVAVTNKIPKELREFGRHPFRKLQAGVAGSVVVLTFARIKFGSSAAVERVPLENDPVARGELVSFFPGVTTVLGDCSEAMVWRRGNAEPALGLDPANVCKAVIIDGCRGFCTAVGRHADLDLVPLFELRRGLIEILNRAQSLVSRDERALFDTAGRRDRRRVVIPDREPVFPLISIEAGVVFEPLTVGRGACVFRVFPLGEAATVGRELVADPL